MIRTAVAVALTGLVMAVTAWSGVAVQAGAHPFWAGTVPLIGLVAALPLCGLGLRWPRAGVALGLILALGGAAAAGLGKAAFAASFAEDALAGQAWYLGWIVSCAGASALIFLTFLAMIRWVSARG